MGSVKFELMRQSSSKHKQNKEAILLALEKVLERLRGIHDINKMLTD